MMMPEPGAGHRAMRGTKLFLEIQWQKPKTAKIRCIYENVAKIGDIYDINDKKVEHRTYGMRVSAAAGVVRWCGPRWLY